jgi:membrane-anchored glycerophosphoryl diester phosphodiesterase (GDPDase)
VFLAAMLAFWIASGLALGIVVGLASVTGVVALAGLVTAACLVAVLYCTLRMALVMPVIAVEGERNPLAALRRSWALTRGNAGRIFLVVALLFVVYFVISLALTAVVGILAQFILGQKAGDIAVAVATSAAGALFTLYMIAVLAMIHRQLSGGSPQVIGSTFD